MFTLLLFTLTIGLSVPYTLHTMEVFIDNAAQTNQEESSQQVVTIILQKNKPSSREDDEEIDHIILPRSSVKQCSTLENFIQTTPTGNLEVIFSEDQADHFESIKRIRPRLEMVENANSLPSLNKEVMFIMHLDSKKNKTIRYFLDSANYLGSPNAYNFFHTLAQTRMRDLSKNKKLKKLLSFALDLQNSDHWHTALHLSHKEFYEYHPPFIASASSDKTIKLWNVKEKKCTLTLNQRLLSHTNSVSSVRFSLDGSLLASSSSSNDNSIKLWDVKEKKCIHTFNNHPDVVNSACFSPDGSLIAFCSGKTQIKLWDINQKRLFHTFDALVGWGNEVCFSPDGSLLASCSHEALVKVWDINQKTLLTSFNCNSRWVNAVCFSPDGSLLACAASDKTIKLWNINKKKSIHTFKAHSDEVFSICFSHDGSLLASGHRDGTIKLWNINEEKCIHTFYHTDAVESVCFSPDDSLLASCSRDKSIQLWDINQKTLSHSFYEHTKEVNSVCFSPALLQTRETISLSALWLLQYLLDHEKTMQQLPSKPLYFDAFADLPTRYQNRFTYLVDKEALEKYLTA